VNGSTASTLAEPVRVLSDLHLGHPASRIGEVGSLRPLLEGAATVVFNGDSCEQAYSKWRGPAEQMLDELRGLCLEMGIQPVFLTGNHDPDISDVGWIDLGGVFVSHGDMVFRSAAPWSFEFLRNREKINKILRERPDTGAPRNDLAYRYETALQLHAAMRPEGGSRSGGGYLLSGLWPPRRCFALLRAWATMAGEAERFLSRYRPEARAFLCGHFHRPGVWERKGRIICNTGSFMQRMSALVAEVAGPALVIRRVEASGREFGPGAILRSVDLGTSQAPRSA
jgi:predicted phosphodiesterase